MLTVQVTASVSFVARVADDPKFPSTNMLPVEAASKSAADATVCAPVAVKVLVNVKLAAASSDAGAEYPPAVPAARVNPLVESSLASVVSPCAAVRVADETARYFGGSGDEMPPSV